MNAMETSGYRGMNANQYSAERDRRDGSKHSLLGAQHPLSQPDFGGEAAYSGRQCNDVDDMNNDHIMVFNTESASAEDASGMQPGAEDARSYQQYFAHIPAAHNQIDNMPDTHQNSLTHNMRLPTTSSARALPEGSIETDADLMHTQRSLGSFQQQEHVVQKTNMEKNQRQFEKLVRKQQTVRQLEGVQTDRSLRQQYNDLNTGSMISLTTYPKHDLSIGSQKSLNLENVKSQVRIICRIKPAKVINQNEIRKQLEFQKLRSSRSNPRAYCGRAAFGFVTGGGINGIGSNQNSESQFNIQQAYERDRSTSREIQADSLRKPIKAGPSMRSTRQYIYSQNSSPCSRMKSRNIAMGQSRVGSADGLASDKKKPSQTIALTGPLSAVKQLNIPGAGGIFSSQRRSSSTQRRNSRSGNHPILFYNKMLKNDALYCVFTTRETSKFVLACDQPYSGKLLNESFSTIQDQEFLKNLPVQFKFDAVYDETSSGRQDKIYTQNVRPMVHNFVEGGNACVALFGPSSCGKTFTLKGGQGSERGIVPRAIEDILSLIKNPEVDEKELDKTPNFQNFHGPKQKVFLKIAIFMISMEQIADLLGKPKDLSYAGAQDEIASPSVEHYIDQGSNQVVSRLVNLQERLILCTEDFYIAIADAYRYRKELGSSNFQDKDLRKKSHFIINLTLVQQLQDNMGKFMQLAQMSFVELSGSEQAVNSNKQGCTYQNIKETPTHEFVSKSFNSLSCHLMKLIQRKKKNSSQSAPISEDTETKLVSCLRSTMSQTSNILLINCVDPNQQMFEHSLPSLKFCASMRDQIQKRLKKSLQSGKGGHQAKTKKSQKVAKSQQEDVQNLMASQIKTSEKVMNEIKIKLIDLEYKLQRNPQDHEVLQECQRFLRELRELSQDFDTLIQYASSPNNGNRNELDFEVLNRAECTKNKLKYLDDKIAEIINQNSRKQILQESMPISFGVAGDSATSSLKYQPIGLPQTHQAQMMIQMGARAHGYQQPAARMLTPDNYRNQSHGRASPLIAGGEGREQQVLNSQRPQMGIQVYNDHQQEDLLQNQYRQYTLSTEGNAVQSTNAYFQGQHQATRDAQRENLGAGEAASSARQGGSEAAAMHYSNSKSKPQQMHNDGFLNLQQFNTVDNRQIGQVPSSQLQGQIQRQIDATQSSSNTLRSRSRSRSQSRMALQQDGGVGAHDAGGQGASYRSARSSLDDAYFPRLPFPVNGGSINGGAGAAIANNSNMNDHISNNFNMPCTSMPAKSSIRSNHLYTMQSNLTQYTPLSKHQNLIQATESKFSQLKDEIQPPRLMQVSDLPSLEQIQLNQPLSAENKNSFLDDLQNQPQLYKSEDELANDVCRLMLLQDQEGLKLRVLQLFRDRNQVLQSAKAEVAKHQGFEHQRKAQSTLMQEYTQAISQNSEEIQRYTSELDGRYRIVETELVNNLKDQQKQIKQLTETIQQSDENMDILKKEKELAESNRQEEHKHRLETDKLMAEVDQENQKLKQNYEIIKEHEMSIIRDCENRKQAEVKAQEELTHKEREKYLEQQHRAELLRKDISDLQQNIRSLENDAKLHQQEILDKNKKSETQSSEIVVLKEECSSLKSKHCEDTELIQILRKQQESLKLERDEKQRDIQKLKLNLQTNEKSVDNQHQMFLKVQSEIKLLEKDLEQLRCEKHALKEQLTKQKDEHAAHIAGKDIRIQAVKDEKLDAERKLNTHLQMIAQKDKELLAVKAKEYDKVDVIRKVAELEGQCKLLNEEKERLQKQKDQIEMNFENIQTENQQMADSLNQYQAELERMKADHASNLDQFDTKFDDLHRVMEQQRGENHAMKNQLSMLKDQNHDSEKEKNYWRDKCRMAERKGDEINQKIVELENELRTILYDRQHHNAEGMRPAEDQRRMEARPPIERQVSFGGVQSMVAKNKLHEAQSIAQDENRRHEMQRSPENSMRSAERRHTREQEAIQGRRESKDQNIEPDVRSTRDQRGMRETRALKNPLHVPQASGHPFAQEVSFQLEAASKSRREDPDYREEHKGPQDEGDHPGVGSRSGPGTRIGGSRIPPRDAAGVRSHADNAQIRLPSTLGQADGERTGGQLFGANRSLSRGSYLRDGQSDRQEDEGSQNTRETRGGLYHEDAGIGEELGDRERRRGSRDPSNGGARSQDRRGDDAEDGRFSYPSFQPSPGLRSGADGSADRIYAEKAVAGHAYGLYPTNGPFDQAPEGLDDERRFMTVDERQDTIASSSHGLEAARDTPSMRPPSFPRQPRGTTRGSH